jgi:hypothetical protein
MDEFKRQRLAELLLSPNDDPFERAAARTRRSVARRVVTTRQGDGLLQTMDNAVRQVARGTPFGSFMDEFAAGADAATYPVLGRGSTADSFAQRYAENVAQERARDEAFEASNPAAALGLQLGGALLSAGVAPAATVMKGATLLPKTVNAATTGLGYGAIYGAGEGEGLDRLKNAGIGAGIGGVFGAAVPVVTRGVSNASEYVTDGFTDVLRREKLAQALMAGAIAVPSPNHALVGSPGIGAVRAQAPIVAPAIKSPNAPLFPSVHPDEVPKAPQLDILRRIPPHGVPEWTQALADPANVARVNKIAEQGIKQGGLGWYNTEPLRQAFIEELGAQKGNEAFAKYINLVAATSPLSTTGVNARNASYYYMLAQQGRDLPQRVREGTRWSLAEPLPSPYGHRLQALHVQNADNVRNNGGLPALRYPKLASFSSNLQGNWTPVTIDMHNARLWGLVDSRGRPLDIPARNQYGFMEALQQEQAKKLGVTPAQYQVSAWIGGGPQTGLRSSTDPFLKVLEQRIERRAAHDGLTKEEVLRRFIRGELPLLGLAAGVLPAPGPFRE